MPCFQPQRVIVKYFSGSGTTVHDAKAFCIDILIYTYRNVAETLHTTYVWRRESDFIASLVLSAERCELSAAVVGGVRVVLREAH